MRFAGIIQASIEILDDFFTSKKSIKSIVKDWGKTRRFAGSKDRHKIANLVYNILRSYPSFKALSRTGSMEEIVLISLLCGPEAMTHEDLAEALKTSPYAAYLLDYLPSADYLENLSIVSPNAAVIFANIEAWQEKYLKESFGEHWPLEAEALCYPAPIDIRINSLRSMRHPRAKLTGGAAVVQSLALPDEVALAAQADSKYMDHSGLADHDCAHMAYKTPALNFNDSDEVGIIKNPSLPGHDLALTALPPELSAFRPISKELPYAFRKSVDERVGKKQNLTLSSAYAEGQFEIQDFGSQFIAKLIGAQPNMQILDYCAGAGGKSLAMAADMENIGKIWAYDKYGHRLDPIYERIKRAGATSVRPLKKLNLPYETMDIVVVDVPCSGSGTWRRSPDLKYLLSENKLKDILLEQQQILCDASKYVKPGGFLCYLTCSVFAAENDQQISKFLEDIAYFKLDDSKKNQLNHPSYKTPYGLLLTPFKSGCDGFYFSALQRVLI